MFLDSLFTPGLFREDLFCSVSVSHDLGPIIDSLKLCSGSAVMRLKDDIACASCLTILQDLDFWILGLLD